MEYLKLIRTKVSEMIRPVNTIATAKVGGNGQDTHSNSSVPSREQIDKKSNDLGASPSQSFGKPNTSIPPGFVQVSGFQFSEQKSVTTIIDASGAACSAISHNLEAVSSQPGQRQPQITIVSGHAVVNKDLMKGIRGNVYKPTPYRPATSHKPESGPKL